MTLFPSNLFSENRAALKRQTRDTNQQRFFFFFTCKAEAGRPERAHGQDANAQASDQPRRAPEIVPKRPRAYPRALVAVVASFLAATPTLVFRLLVPLLCRSSTVFPVPCHAVGAAAPRLPSEEPFRSLQPTTAPPRRCRWGRQLLRLVFVVVTAAIVVIVAVLSWMTPPGAMVERTQRRRRRR